MSKYHRLTAYLGNLTASEWRATFDEVERILGFQLPASAYDHPAWWANQAGGHAQSSSWQDAGWRTESLDLENKTVTFTRRPRNAFANFETGLMERKPFLNALAAPAAIREAPFLTGLVEGVRPLTISQAKAGLAAQFGISEDSIEIIIKG